MVSFLAIYNLNYITCLTWSNYKSLEVKNKFQNFVQINVFTEYYSIGIYNLNSKYTYMCIWNSNFNLWPHPSSKADHPNFWNIQGVSPVISEFTLNISISECIQLYSCIANWMAPALLGVMTTPIGQNWSAIGNISHKTTPQPTINHAGY